ncbi:serpin family protein [Hoyosella rhizosphaerae]|uniref:Serpin n=1 Tax=Hoyosella rhizosphaerae TaxID=1755582 RepID=A0A916XG43_9ACTN|nr:serpin family protein [Hoyosella rhizosphaerae]MBN4927896.1 serpin family protein [Hoyosella rhizosphaerae]GGC70818.1 serpin [Hoyosella rhizosphaerae]
MRKLIVLGVAAALACTAGCGATDTDDEATETPPTLVEQEESAPDVVSGLYGFSARFSAELSEPGTNTVYSPLSIATAFAMLRAGAEGETATQLDELFGYPSADLHASFSELLKATVTVDEAPDRAEPGSTRGADEPPVDPIVAIAQGLFVADGLSLNPEFTDTLSEYFDADPEPVDFTAADATDIVNAWVERNTAGRIDTLFDDLDPATVAVIANAIYLKAEWEIQFNESQTGDETFTTADGNEVTVPMMNKSDLRVQHLEEDGWNSIALPYVGGDIAMWVVLNDTADSESDAPGAAPVVTSGMLESFAAGGETRSAQVAIPRWDFSSTVTLLDTLRELGLTDLAGLSGVTPDFELSDGVHRANITVDESGTEAAAVTGLAGVTSMPPDSQLDFRVDRPFSFVIMHQPTGAPLFVGAVENPNE